MIAFDGVFAFSEDVASVQDDVSHWIFGSILARQGFSFQGECHWTRHVSRLANALAEFRLAQCLCKLKDRKKRSSLSGCRPDGLYNEFSSWQDSDCG